MGVFLYDVMVSAMGQKSGFVQVRKSTCFRLLFIKSQTLNIKPLLKTFFEYVSFYKNQICFEKG